MTSADTGRVLVGVAEIAEIAQVGRSAVGNWRKRRPDFPTPQVQTPAGALFEFGQVEKWLIENGKISGSIPREVVVWRLADALRAQWTPEQLGEFLVACLVYLEAGDSRRDQANDTDTPSVDVDESDRWESVRTAPDARVITELLAAARRIEVGNPRLKGLIADGLSQSPPPEGGHLRILLDTLQEAADDPMSPRFGLFEEVVSQVQRAQRFRGEYTTPPDVTHLLVRLGQLRGGTVVDPAAGEGGLLLMAALGDDRDTSLPLELIGYEVNERVLRTARARFFLYGVDAELRVGDAFRVPANELPEADLVLLDPPLGQHDWGDADVYLDDRWSFGVPPPSTGDLAWAQLAIQCLKPGGIGVVVLPPGAAWRAGREQGIRKAMLEAGVVEAVIFLPPRLRTNTSIPLTVWILRAPSSTHRDEVLLVDASSLGDPGRSQYSLDENDIGRIVRIVHDWRASGRVAEADGQLAFSVSLGELPEANLNPKNHQPVPEANLVELRARAEALRSSLDQHLEEALDAARSALAQVRGPE